MKSKHPDRQLQTSCKECVFAVYEDDFFYTQTGCAANKINEHEAQGHLIEAYDDEKEFYVIDCLCTYFRPPAWNQGKPDLDLIAQENLPKFCIAVYTDDITGDKWKKTADSIRAISYNKNNMVIIISQSISFNAEKKRMATEFHARLSSYDINAEVVTLFNHNLRDYETFKHSDNGYLIKIDVGELVPCDMFDKIDRSLNKDLARAVVFNDGETTAISFFTFRARYPQHKNYHDFEESVTKEARSCNLYLDIT